MKQILADRQIEFIVNSTRKWNLAHGSVRSGKTVGTLFRFMEAVEDCPDSQIWMVGHSSDTIFQNAIRLLLESDQLAIFKPFCSWLSGKRQLKFKDKTINTLGAKDEGAIGSFQGKTFSLVYCDEITLYPETIIDMIDTRLSNPHSMGFASMNPSHPNHKVKKWIDMAEAGDPNYYSLHFTLDDNPFVDNGYKQRIRNSLSGLFYKRNYLGLWCLAEGAIFDFFDRKIHVVDRPPTAAEYWVAGIDYGTINAFSCSLIGVSSGKYTQTGRKMWVEKEYYWDSKKKGRQKTNSEYADDMVEFLEPYGVRHIYCDPSAASFKLELKKRGLHVLDGNNDVNFGIQVMSDEMKKGNFFICSECTNTIREFEGYVWDSRASSRGYDEPIKKDDHACFIKGTLVSTDKGYVPIEEIKIGDMILTPKGYFPCIDTMIHFSSDIWELDTPYGNLIGTGDHPIILENEELSLKSFDGYYKIYSVKEVSPCLKKSNSMESYTEDTQNQKTYLIESILEHMYMELKKEKGTFTEIFGNFIMDLSQKASTFITLMETNQTMTSQTCSVYPQKNTCNCILCGREKLKKQKPIWKILDLSQKNGMPVKKVENGIKNTVWKHGKLENTSHTIVNNVEEITKQKISPHINSAGTTVNRHLEEIPAWTMKHASARCVATRMSVTNILDRKIAQKNAHKVPVFNITVDKEHVYFANNILVSNCDSSRYVLASHKVARYDHEVEIQRQQDYLKNRYMPTRSF